MFQRVIEASRAADMAQTRRLSTEPWSAIKVFTAPLCDGENAIGDAVTCWLSSHPVALVEIVVAQSRTECSGCISVALFYRERDADDR